MTAAKDSPGLHPFERTRQPKRSGLRALNLRNGPPFKATRVGFRVIRPADRAHVFGKEFFGKVAHVIPVVEPDEGRARQKPFCTLLQDSDALPIILTPGFRAAEIGQERRVGRSDFPEVFLAERVGDSGRPKPIGDAGRFDALAVVVMAAAGDDKIDNPAVAIIKRVGEIQEAGRIWPEGYRFPKQIGRRTIDVTKPATYKPRRAFAFSAAVISGLQFLCRRDQSYFRFVATRFENVGITAVEGHMFQLSMPKVPYLRAGDIRTGRRFYVQITQRGEQIS